MKRRLLKFVTKIMGVEVPLSKSIEFGIMEDVEIMFEMNKNLDYHGIYDDSFIYPLMTSVYFGRENICSFLLDKGANSNLKYNKERKKQTGEICTFFTPFYDPKRRISNHVTPPGISRLDLKSWRNVTPTVLAYALGNYEILRLCLRKGGRLHRYFDSEEDTFIGYFFSHSSTCQPRTCELLIEYREFFLSQNELASFRDLYERVQRMEENSMIDPCLSRDFFQIFRMLRKYGFASTESKKPKLHPREIPDECSFTTTTSSSSSSDTASDSEGDWGKVRSGRRRRIRILRPRIFEERIDENEFQKEHQQRRERSLSLPCPPVPSLPRPSQQASQDEDERKKSIIIEKDTVIIRTTTTTTTTTTTSSSSEECIHISSSEPSQESSSRIKRKLPPVLKTKPSVKRKNTSSSSTNEKKFLIRKGSMTPTRYSFSKRKMSGDVDIDLRKISPDLVRKSINYRKKMEKETGRVKKISEFLFL